VTASEDSRAPGPGISSASMRPTPESMYRRTPACLRPSIPFLFDQPRNVDLWEQAAVPDRSGDEATMPPHEPGGGTAGVSVTTPSSQ